MGDPLTNWVDGRIRVGVTAAVDALLAHEDEILTNAAAKFRTAIIGDIQAVPAALGNLVTNGFQQLPGQISAIEAAGLRDLEAIPQQTASAVGSLIAGLPATIVQAIGSLFPHFIAHLADLPAAARDSLFAQAAARTVESIQNKDEGNSR